MAVIFDPIYVREASEILGVHRTTIYRMIKRVKIKNVMRDTRKDRAAYLLCRSEVDRLANSQ